MYELAVVLHDESGNNKGNGIQLIKEATHTERIRYDASISPHVLHVPGISCPDITSLQSASSGHGTDITSLQSASSGHGTDITSLQNTLSTLQNTINTQALTISALNNTLTNLTKRVETLEDPMAAVHVDNN
jgi:hypothetical protein